MGTACLPHFYKCRLPSLMRSNMETLLPTQPGLWALAMRQAGNGGDHALMRKQPGNLWAGGWDPAAGR